MRSPGIIAPPKGWPLLGSLMTTGGAAQRNRFRVRAGETEIPLALEVGWHVERLLSLGPLLADLFGGDEEEHLALGRRDPGDVQRAAHIPAEVRDARLRLRQSGAIAEKVVG